MESSNEGFYASMEQIKDAFNQLVHHRFIIAAPITSPTIAASNNETSDFVKKKVVPSNTSGRAMKSSSSSSVVAAKEPVVAAVKVEPTTAVARNPGRRKQQHRATAEETSSSSIPSDLPVELQLMMTSCPDLIPMNMEQQQLQSAEQPQIEQAGGKKRPNPNSNGMEKVAKKMRGRSNILSVTSYSGQVEVEAIEQSDSGGYLGSMSGQFSSEVNIGQDIEQDAMLNSNVVWTLGWDQLYRECRHQCCVNFAAARNESLAGSVVRTILSASMSLNSDVGYLQTKSAPLSAEKIHQKLLEEAADAHGNSSSSSSSGVRMKMEMGTTQSQVVDIVTLRKLLEIMRLDSMPVLLKVIGSDKTPGGPEYMVNMETTKHKIAVDRFGQASGRIIELLTRNKFLEQQAISDMVLVPAREARERLYRLYRDRWVNYVELSKRCDFSPATSFFFWFLDLDRMQSAIVNHLYQSVYNLKIRRAFEYAKERHLIDFPVTSEYDQTRYDALLNKLKTLDNAIINLDKTVMLLDKL
eukprot:gene29315-38392_t